MSDLLRVVDRGHVRLLTLNRPDQRNAFNVEMYRALTAALKEAEDGEDIGAVVLTGAGTAFSSGTDLDELKAIAAGDLPDGGADAFPQLLSTLISTDMPLVAAVNGAGVGLGLTMLGYFDLVFVSEAARFKAPFVEMGVPPEAASSFLLPATLGWQQACRLMLAGEWLSAKAAVAAGLAVEMCPAGELVGRAMQAATQIASHPVPAVRTAKRLMSAARRDGLLAARGREDEAYKILFGRDH